MENKINRQTEKRKMDKLLEDSMLQKRKYLNQHC